MCSKMAAVDLDHAFVHLILFVYQPCTIVIEWCISEESLQKLKSYDTTSIMI